MGIQIFDERSRRLALVNKSKIKIYIEN